MLSNVSYASTCWCSVIRKCLQASDWWISCKLVMKKYKRPSLSRNAFHRKHKKHIFNTCVFTILLVFSWETHTRFHVFSLFPPGYTYAFPVFPGNTFVSRVFCNHRTQDRKHIFNIFTSSPWSRVCLKKHMRVSNVGAYTTRIYKRVSTLVLFLAWKHIRVFMIFLV